jgi:prepilin-type N-terminal cleavage/methylation domain-containing protein
MKHKGFSLIEILVAIGILSGIVFVLSQSFFSIGRSSTKADLIKDMKQSGNFSLSIMEQMIRSSIGITSSCVPTGSTGSSVTLVNKDGNSSTFGCFLDTTKNITRIASTSASTTVYLTSDNVTLGGSNCSDQAMTLVITCKSDPPSKNSVGIGFTLYQAGAPVGSFNRAQTPFQITVNSRN